MSNPEHDRSPARRSWLRVGLSLLSAAPLAVGAWASLAAWLVYAVPHFAFHLTTLDVFPLGDNLANVAVLGLAVLLPLVLLAMSGKGTDDAFG